MNRQVLYSLLLTLLGGILMGIAAEPMGLWLFGWVAFVPLWVNSLGSIKADANATVGKEKSKGQKIPRLPFLFALVWGIGYYGISLSWITGIHPMTWLGVPWLASLAIALFCWVFITLWGTALTIVWTGLLIFLSPPSSPFSFSKYPEKNPVILALTRILIGTALWCGLESIWSSGALWWSSLSYTQSFGNLVILHLGQISGPTTITASLLIVNGLIAEAFISFQEKNSFNPANRLLLGLALIFFVTVHSIGLSLYQQPLRDSSEQALKVGLIQGNIPNEIKLDYQGFIKALNGYTTGYITLADQGVDAVLTPESALPFFWTDSNQRHKSSFYQAILQKNVTAWLGSFALKEGGYTNSLFTINGEGEIISQYDKVNLVPLGEFIPFTEILGKFIKRLSPLDAGLIHGQPDQQFKTPFGQAIVGICYDSAFAQHFRRQAQEGGEFILTASNDAHYSSSMLAQHHAQDVMRAIETDRWAVRATNTGYSAIVDPHGRTLWMSGQNTYELHTDQIYRRQTQTLYVRWGDWLLGILIIGATILRIKK